MNNFWIPEEINLSLDVKDYPRLLSAERSAYDKILSFLVFLDSIQTANLPNIGAYITANEVNLCQSIQAFQECVHSQSYIYMLDTICSPVERNDILYQWKTDEHLLRRNTFIGDCYNEFQERKDAPTLLRVMMANYILEGNHALALLTENPYALEGGGILTIKSHCVALLSLYQMMCLSLRMETSFSTVALSAPSIIIPAPFTGGEKDLYTFVGEPFRPMVSTSMRGSSFRVS